MLDFEEQIMKPAFGSKAGDEMRANAAFVSGLGSFLPGDPVSNGHIDEVLVPLNDAPPEVGKNLRALERRIHKIAGIAARHFAVDPADQRLTHTVASLAEEAARRALSDAQKTPADVDLLVVSCPAYDQMTPPTSAMLQERLGIADCAEIEIHSNCSGVGKMVQVAYDALRVGRYRTALVVYPQLSSALLRSQYYNQVVMTRSQAALRYILADGAGAMLLQSAKAPADGFIAREILGTHIESVGANRKPGMTAGLGMSDLFESSSLPKAYDEGRHHLDQDFDAVNADAVAVLFQGGLRMLDSLHLPIGEIDHFVFSIPNKHFYEVHLAKESERFGVSPDRIKFRGETTGYCGGASILLHFDEMVRKGEIERGQIVALYSVESSKWVSGGFVVRW